MMKIVRAFWGNVEKSWQEIPKRPIWKDEVVFVWGIESYKKLQIMGYECVLMNRDITDKEYSNFLNHFTHKLLCLAMADQLYDEYLFLDWDVKIVKEIDDRFWELVRSKQIQCPVYGYPINYAEKCRKYISELEPNTWTWVDAHDIGLEKYNWKLGTEHHIVPNFCFFYSYKGKIAQKLIDIKHQHNVDSCIEEFCMFIYACCDLDTFLNKYEPLVIRGREDTCHHFRMEDDDTMRIVNKYVASVIKKDIYLIHE